MTSHHDKKATGATSGVQLAKKSKCWCVYLFLRCKWHADRWSIAEHLTALRSCIKAEWRIHTSLNYSISQEICTRFLLCCALLWLYSISIRLTSLALWQSNDCPSASKATLMNMDKYFMWIHYERLHNHNKAKHNKTVRIFLGIYCNAINDSENGQAIIRAIAGILVMEPLRTNLSQFWIKSQQLFYMKMFWKCRLQI